MVTFPTTYGVKTVSKQTKQKILRAVFENEGITGKELANVIRKTPSTIRRHCVALVEQGLIVQEKKVRWDNVIMRDGLFGNTAQAKRTFYVYRTPDQG